MTRSPWSGSIRHQEHWPLDNLSCLIGFLAIARAALDLTSNRVSEQTPRTRSWNIGDGLSRPQRSAMAIPKGRPSEERVASEEAGSVEVVTTPGEHQDPENCHARYPGGRHHCHATLPHVILRQHRQKTITLPYRNAIERVVDPIGSACICARCVHDVCTHVRVFLLAKVSVVCAHSAFYDTYATHCGVRLPFLF